MKRYTTHNQGGAYASTNDVDGHRASDVRPRLSLGMDGDVNLRSIGIASISSAALTSVPEVVHFVDGTTMPYNDIARVIPCFTPGTRIATPKGEVLVERLKTGDRVLTRDNGIQTITWLGQKKLDHLQLKALKELKPILIKAGALGDGKPERDMKVSPMHRMLVVSDVAQMYFGQSEVLVVATDLLQVEGVEVADVPYVTYVHFMCDRHEVVLSDGAWSESFQPGDYSLKGLDDPQRAELFSLFPDLTTKEGVMEYKAARRTLQSHEALALFSA